MKILHPIFACLLISASLFGQKLIDEDFTTGQFDGFGAGENGENWHLYGPGTAFRAPNDRDFPFALSNRIQAGGGGWADGAQWYIGDKKADDQMAYFQVHKYNDVVLLRFTTFSDYAYSNNKAGVEVAFLEWRDSLNDYTLHFGHDLSWEAMNCYYTPSGKGGSPNQLEVNMENTDPNNYTSISGIKSAYTNSWYTKSDLNNTQTATVIWRNEPAYKQCNIESYAPFNKGDYWLDTHMVSLLDPGNEYALFSFIQITLFRGASTEPGSNFIQRDAIDYNDVQIGIKHLEAGITKRSDFNLDYTVDDQDASLLNEHWNQSGTNIQTGDANNDGRTDYKDACQLIAFYSNADTSSVEVSGLYNSSNGNILLNLQNISYFSVRASSESILTADAPNTGSFFHDKHHDNDTVFSAYTMGEWNQEINLGTIAQSGLNPADIRLHFNYKGSQQAQGFSIPLDGTVYTSSSSEAHMTNSPLVSIYPNPVHDQLVIRGSNKPATYQIYTVTGQLVWQGETSGIIQTQSLQNGLYILRVAGSHIKFTKQ